MSKKPTNQKPEETPIEIANNLIASSGNTFHCQVINFLKKDGWQTTISPYYLDEMQNKAREIDLIATKVFHHKFCPKQHQLQHFAIRLLIECKFIPSAAVFWMFDKNIERAREIIEKAGIFRRNDFGHDDHHYLERERVAKLFSSSKSINEENEPIYKALNQILAAYTALERRPINYTFDNSIRNKNPQIINSLTFPVVILNSFEKVFKVEQENPTEPIEVDRNFQLEVDYAFMDKDRPVNRSFLIDVIDFTKLTSFTDTMDKLANEAILRIP